ncbi:MULTISPECIES: cysteine hydrolase family protein [unclassified Neptuniibacter]|jgi:nicotinamidase-related amidase|uniref:cysteine hydrolase family protein n=1 Tax=unclassified Neptuniibacter TaxID=2630693 RepID=UPI0026E2443A|nr:MULTISPECIES: cysteine hydrolase family protein [unclassified Neptuniibacter]MDO6514810.1 cysteine hydrolase family protein [Neptuniibacter sp. 2_MG-2023]MDO6593320.1 cysteine hydrolase family protein [Neptuniibacter sp. 1_MG-2023]
MTSLSTIRDLAGLGHEASSVQESALIIIDAQNTYCEGIMKLEGVEEALVECRKLLERFRKAGRPIYHIRHDAGPGTPYDVNEHIGQIAEVVAPIEGEAVITKNYPNSFAQTELNELLEKTGVKNLILVGFMSHMCVNSTARAAFTLGYNPTVVASATATRALPSKVTGKDVPAAQIQEAALAALSDLPSAVVPAVSNVPD